MEQFWTNFGKLSEMKKINKQKFVLSSDNAYLCNRKITSNGRLLYIKYV